MADVVVISVDELSELVEAAVKRALDARDGARKQHDAGDWLDTNEAAKLLKVHPRSVRKMVKFQGLPSHPITDKLHRYNRRELLAWIEERRNRKGTSHV